MSEFIFTTTKTTTAIATTTLPPTLDGITATLGDTFVHYLNYLGKVPGGTFLLWYIKASYKNDPIRSLFELGLFLFGIRYFLKDKRKEDKSELVKFSKREVDELIDDWKPAPLVETVKDIESWQIKSIPQIKGHNGATVELLNLNKAKNVKNFAINDFLDFNSNKVIQAAAKAVISTTGVGACSAPNFYGTQAVHVRLEEDISKYLNTDSSIIYGQDFVTPSSVLPAFVKRGDLCVVDSGVNLAIQKALIVSRCDVEWYNHNDMAHLKSVLEGLKSSLDKQKPLCRRFIVTEGLFSNSGSIVDLPELVKLKNQFKYRVFLEESNSIGVLGKTGRGVTEHFSISNAEIAITCGSMANSFGSAGGFCTGAKAMIHHQRLGSLAYVFSASLPPYSAKVSSAAIQEILNVNDDGYSKLMEKLHKFIKYGFTEISKCLESCSFVEVVSDAKSPIVHITLADEYRKKLDLPPYYGNVDFIKSGQRSKYNNTSDLQYLQESFLLQSIIDKVLARKNALIARSKNIIEHENLPIRRPRLLVFLNIGSTEQDVNNLVDGLDDIINEVCGNINDKYDLEKLEQEMVNY